MTATRDLALVAAVLSRRFGWNYPEERWMDLERHLRRVAAERSLSEEQIHETVLSPLWPEGFGESLVRQLTVGETYFWREPRTLEAFRDFALPQISRSVPNREPLRFWSAGCSTGEEAYTLAILLLESLGPHTLERVTIHATDVNEQALQRARTGIYGSWSFRNIPAEIRTRHFRPLPGGTFEVMPHLREHVTFSAVNLANPRLPGLFGTPETFAAIFCRNVLIYFDREQALRLLERLRQSLMNCGWLLVSPSEVPVTSNSELHRVAFPGVTVFRKLPSPAPKPAPEPPVFRAFPTQPTPSRPYSTRKAPPAVSPPAPPKPAPSPAAFSDLHVEGEARDAAGRGDYETARAKLNQAIAADRLNPELHYLCASIALEAGDLEAAREALRRTLFLAPDMVVAHYLMANIARAQGLESEARRQLATTRQLLNHFADEETVPHSEGMTAGHLKAMVGEVTR